MLRRHPCPPTHRAAHTRHCSVQAWAQCGQWGLFLVTVRRGEPQPCRGHGVLDGRRLKAQFLCDLRQVPYPFSQGSSQSC